MKDDEKFETVMTYIGRVMLIITLVFAIILFCKLTNEYIDIVNKVQTLESKLQELQKDNEELWKNIDALSEDYTTIWVQLYGEDSWYESSEDKEKVHKEIENMKGE